MIKEEIKIYRNAADLSEGLTAFLTKLFDIFPHINIALSGGTTPQAVFDYWAENCKAMIDWSRISFFWGDERCVPPDDALSNYGMTAKHLFDKVVEIPDKNIFRIQGENDPEKEAERYSKILESNLKLCNNIPCFEVVLLGLGDDGHTLSIFPDQLSLWNSKKFCLTGEHPESKMKRITISGQVVNNAQYVAFLVTGKNKAGKVRDIIKNREQFTNQYPAAKVNPENGYLYWFLDAEAASLIR